MNASYPSAPVTSRGRRGEDRPLLRGRGVSLPLAVALAALLPGAAVAAAGPGKVDYNRDVRPILAEHCYTCHGPDASKRKAKLRLDRRDGAFAVSRSGRPAVRPGDRSGSELFLRVVSGNERERMPPPGAAKELTQAQVELLGRWIDQGAS